MSRLDRIEGWSGTVFTNRETVVTRSVTELFSRLRTPWSPSCVSVILTSRNLCKHHDRRTSPEQKIPLTLLYNFATLTITTAAPQLKMQNILVRLEVSFALLYSLCIKVSCSSRFELLSTLEPRGSTDDISDRSPCFPFRH